MTEQVPVTMVNHVALEMAAAPDAVWREILSDYVEAKKFREFGTIEPLDDPAAIFGGYRMRFEQDSVVDERIVHITERDDTARRLSVMADYLSVPGGMRVYATYHAREAAGGTSYAIDCHTSVKVDAPAGGDGPDLAAAVAEMTSGADVHLNAYLASIKARVETPG